MKKALGIALIAVGLATGGAIAQNAPQPQAQKGAAGTGTSNAPGQPPMASPQRQPGATNVPTSSQSPQARDQQTAPGTGTAQAPGQAPRTTTGSGMAPKGNPNMGVAPGTNTNDRGSAPGTGTAAPASR